MSRSVLLFSLTSLALPLLRAQDPAPPAPSDTPAPPAASGPQRPGFRGQSQEPQPYDKVITKDAKSKKGVFTVHQVKEKYYYEIPNSELGKEFLWNTQIAKTTIGVGYGGQELSIAVVHWELNGNKVYLRSINYDIVADPKSPIAEAVKAANNDAILMTFPVAAFGKDRSSAVIDVTRLFTGDIPEFSARQRLNASSIDASRSYIERVSPYPENIEAEATHHLYAQPHAPGSQRDTGRPFSAAEACAPAAPPWCCITAW